MEKTWTLIKRLVKEEEGLEMVEYAVAAGLLTVAVIAVWALLGEAISVRLNALLTAIS
ncbi:MAG: Flp family type IVb pilin [Deltaproteobacteria bacterium]|jgi:pilus assembly protein Flp/PilA|nr:Flp family type IVb pilin [Deltaproteobacteria bacterium]